MSQNGKFRGTAPWAALLALLFGSCVNDDYDFDKKINNDVQIGGSLVLPIGETDPIRLDRILKIDDGFVTDLGDGTYAIEQRESVRTEIGFDPITLHIAPFLFSDFSLDFGEFPDVRGAGDGTVTFSAPLSESSDPVTIRETADQLLGLRSIVFTAPVDAELEVAISWNSLPAAVDAIRLQDFVLTLPAFFDAPEAENGVIRFSDTFRRGETYRKTIRLTGASFSDANNPVSAGELLLPDVSVQFAGNIVVTAPLLSLPELQGVTVSTRVTVPDLAVGEVEGRFDPAIDPIAESVLLGDIPKEFSGDNVVFSLLNPAIRLRATNPLEIPVQISDLTLTARTDGGRETSVELPAGETLRFSGAIGTEPSVTRYYLSATGAGAGDWKSVVVPGLPGLLKEIPREVSVLLQPEADASGWYRLDLTPDQSGRKWYELNVEYELFAPLAFASDFRIEYSEVLDDLASDLKDIADKVDRLEIELSVQNEIPLELTVQAVPRDANGLPISGVEITVTGKVAAGTYANGVSQAAESVLKLELRETEANALEALDQLEFQLKAIPGSQTGTPLRMDQSLVIKAKAKAPDGLHFTL